MVFAPLARDDRGGHPVRRTDGEVNSADWAANISTPSPTALVPVLWEGAPGQGFATFDGIAILERPHERHPNAGLWSTDALARAHARSLVADCHASYRALRNAMPMNIRSGHPGKGLTGAVRIEIDRLVVAWRIARVRFGAASPFLFGAYAAADAYFTPVAPRFRTYAAELDAEPRACQPALPATPGMKAWTGAALKETAFVPMDEPYANPP